MLKPAAAATTVNSNFELILNISLLILFNLHSIHRLNFHMLDISQIGRIITGNLKFRV